MEKKKFFFLRYSSFKKRLYYSDYAFSIIFNDSPIEHLHFRLIITKKTCKKNTIYTHILNYAIVENHFKTVT